MLRYASSLFALCLLALSPTLNAAGYKYVTTIATTMPAGSAGASLTDGQPKGVKFSPCSSAAGLDQITLALKYDAGKLTADKRDLYLLFYRPEASGNIFDPHFYPVVKRFPGATYLLNARTTVSEMNAAKATDIYVPAANNLGGAITETILGGNIVLEGLQAGLWMAISIIADSTTVDFDDPSTWLAWDVAPFILRKPWQGDANDTCL